MDARSKAGRNKKLQSGKQSQSLEDSQLSLLNPAAQPGVHLSPASAGEPHRSKTVWGFFNHFENLDSYPKNLDSKQKGHNKVFCFGQS